MKNRRLTQLFPFVLFALLLGVTIYYLGAWPGGAVPTVARPARFHTDTVILDAGHGGEDGGAVSQSGAVESHINLAIAQKLDQILGLYGVDVVMLRTEDISLHDSGSQTLRQKKISDLHNRVAAIEAIPNATLISIHQNTFTGGSKYYGAQVFYANPERSLTLAQRAQDILRQALGQENNRRATEIPDSVYLMNHITCRAILIECGFLSNPTEDALLQTGQYQTKIAAVLTGVYLGFEPPATEEELSNES